MAKQFCSDLTDAELTNKLGGASVESTSVNFTNANLYTGFTVGLKKYGRIVQLFTILISTSTDIARETELFRIPEGYQPSEARIYIPSLGGTTLHTLSVSIENGIAIVSNISEELVKNTYYPLFATWITND